MVELRLGRGLMRTIFSVLCGCLLDEIVLLIELGFYRDLASALFIVLRGYLLGELGVRSSSVHSS